MKDFARRVRETVASSATVDLRRRVAALEDEVLEARALNVRLAEIADIVTDLLVPLARRDDDELRAILTKYRESI